MQKKRMAVISYHTCPLSDEADAEIGGMNIYVLSLSKELAKKGYDIDIFTRSQNPQSERVVQVTDHLRVIHLPAGEEKAINKKDLYNYIPDFLDAFYAFVEKDQSSYSLTSCHYFLSGIIGMDIKEKLGIPFVITFHTLGLMKNLVARSDAERESLERIAFEMQLVKAADQVIATSETDAGYIEYLLEGDPEKIAILTPGVDLHMFTPQDKRAAKQKVGAPTEQKMILFVGRIEPLKGIDVLLYALKILITKYPKLNVCVWIVGGDISQDSDNWPEELKKLSELRDILDIKTSVHFVGRKEQHELPDYYNAAEVLVMPSHYESFGITAVEAMACEVPVITTDVTGVSNLFNQKLSVLLTSTNNPIMLAEKIASLLDDETTYENLRRQLRENVEDLSWENAADQFVKLCKSCSSV